MCSQLSHKGVGVGVGAGEGAGVCADVRETHPKKIGCSGTARYFLLLC